MNDTRKALEALIQAFEKHYELAKDESTPDEELIQADSQLLEAFVTYDDALFTNYGVELPMDTLDYEDDDDFEDDEYIFEEDFDEDEYEQYQDDDFDDDYEDDDKPSH